MIEQLGAQAEDNRLPGDGHDADAGARGQPPGGVHSEIRQHAGEQRRAIAVGDAVVERELDQIRPGQIAGGRDDHQQHGE